MQDIGIVTFAILFSIGIHLILCLPGIIICGFLWKNTPNIKLRIIKKLIQAGLISIAITPTQLGHATIGPAVLAVLFSIYGDWKYSWDYGWKPILIVWLISFVVLLIRKKESYPFFFSKKKGKGNEN